MLRFIIWSFSFTCQLRRRWESMLRNPSPRSYAPTVSLALGAHSLSANVVRLHEIVRLKVLKSDHIKYKLMDRTPPRKQVPRTSTSTLHEAGMWPATRLVVVLFDLPDGMDVSDVISESLVRRKGVLPPHKGNAALSPSEEPATVAPPPDAKMSAASKAGRSGPAVPKWFKK